MNVSLIIFSIAVVFFAYRGYRKGLGASLSRILGLVVGYISAIMFTSSLGAFFETTTSLQGLSCYVVAGLTLFLGGGVLVSVIFFTVGKLLPAHKNLSTLSSVGGGVTGALVGVVVGLVLVWGISFVQEMQPENVQPTKVAPVTTSRPSGIEAVAKRAAGVAVSTAMGVVSDAPVMAQATKALLTSPGETVGHMQQLLHSDDLKRFLNDSRNQSLLDTGNIDALTQQADFQQLYHNANLQALIQAGGLSVDSPEQLADSFSQLWRRSQQVKDNPELQAILRDPEFQQQLKSGNPTALLLNPKLQQMAKIMYAAGSTDLPTNNVASNRSEGLGDENVSRKPTEIHRWVDSQGRIHYSDQSKEVNPL